MVDERRIQCVRSCHNSRNREGGDEARLRWGKLRLVMPQTANVGLWVAPGRAQLRRDPKGLQLAVIRQRAWRFALLSVLYSGPVENAGKWSGGRALSRYAMDASCQCCSTKSGPIPRKILQDDRSTRRSTRPCAILSGLEIHRHF